MLRIVARVAMLAGTLALGACGFADSRAPVPEFMRLKEAEQPPTEPPPDVKRVVREQIEVVFLNTSYPREVPCPITRSADPAGQLASARSLPPPPVRPWAPRPTS